MNFRLFIFLVCFFIFPAPLSAQLVYQAHTRVTLIAERGDVPPATPLWVGVQLRMDRDWHVYWQNPGDSGLAPSIEWKLPEGFTAGKIQWPYPRRINVGPLTSFGYEDEVILWSEISPAPDLPYGKNIEVAARVKWLACKVDCIPGEAELALSLPVRPQSLEIYPAGKKALEKSRLLWPVDSSPWTVRAENHPQNFVLNFSAANAAASLQDVAFFPYDDKLIEHAAVQELKIAPPSGQLIVQKSPLLTKTPQYIEGIVVQANGWDEPGLYRALKIKVPLENSHLFGAAPVLPATVLLICLSAFIGGIILNFMPCVLPVLSLKVIELIKSAGNRRKIFVSGLLFTAGVVVSFWILAGVLLVLKAAGHQLGWGFQFQSPVFVAAIACVLFVLGLNLLGVFEINLGFSLPGLPSTGSAGNFFSGVLATVVATPCTAPFMGTAIGFALAQSPVVAVLIFTCLGLGMASPYLLLCFFPQALRFVPKPGRWMIGLKAILGFILLACVIWLGWVLGLQKGVGAGTVLFAGLWLVGMGLWLWGFIQTGKKNILSMLCVVALSAGGFFWAVVGTDVLPAGIKSSQELKSAGVAWQNFSPQRLAELCSEKKPVFIDFTAAWCLTCQVNDRLVFQNKKVVRAFEDLGIVALKADWTNHDEQITKALTGYGKNSIPLYVLYGDKQDEPVLLPELITPDMVIDILRQQVQQR